MQRLVDPCASGQPSCVGQENFVCTCLRRQRLRSRVVQAIRSVSGGLLATCAICQCARIS